MNAPNSASEPAPSGDSKNPYTSPSEIASVKSPKAPPVERRHPVLSILGWLLAIALTGGTGYFVFLSALLLGYPMWEHIFVAYATSVLVVYTVVFALAFSVMLVVVRRERSNPLRWLHVLPSVLWTQALFAACEFGFFIICSAVMH